MWRLEASYLTCKLVCVNRMPHLHTRHFSDHPVEIFSFLHHSGLLSLFLQKLHQKWSRPWSPSDSPAANTQTIIPSVSVNRPLTDRVGGSQITIVFPPIDLCKYWSSFEVWVKISSLCSWRKLYACEWSFLTQRTSRKQIETYRMTQWEVQVSCVYSGHLKEFYFECIFYLVGCVPDRRLDSPWGGQTKKIKPDHCQ